MPPKRTSTGGAPDTPSKRKRIEDFAFTSSGSKKKAARVAEPEDLIDGASDATREAWPKKPAAKIDGKAKTPTRRPDPAAKAKKRAVPAAPLYVPEATHKHIGYKRQGETEGLHPGLRALFKFALEVCEIPHNFENDRAFGPKSGVSHEDRVVGAFAYKQIQFKEDVDEATRALHPSLRRCVLEADWTGVESVLAERV